MKNGRIYLQTAKMENKPTNRTKIWNKRCSTYRLGYKAREATSRATSFGFMLWRFSWLTCLILSSIFCLNNKIHFSVANANNSASFKRKMV